MPKLLFTVAFLTLNRLTSPSPFAMNRIQFFLLVGLSSLIVLLLIGHILLVRQTNFEQNRPAMAQQALQQGQAFQNNLKQLATRIVQDSQKTQDQGLKDLLTRQQISFTANAENSNPPATPATPPASLR
jgi:uncharacterized protein YpmS